MDQFKDLTRAREVVEVKVGRFKLVDLPRDRVASHIVDRYIAAGRRTTTAAALHVGGLNRRSSKRYVAAMNSFDVVYADGISVYLIARAVGAQSIQAAPTTDVGWDIIECLAERLQRTLRLAVVGGPPGLAEEAAEALTASTPCAVVYTADGYRQFVIEDFAALKAAQPDLLIVGLGMPQEALWCNEHKSMLPNCLIVTCGGWLGFLAGHERRAPTWMRQNGLEWLHRLSQAPRRLFSRYAWGLLTTAVLLAQAAVRRRLP